MGAARIIQWLRQSFRWPGGLERWEINLVEDGRRLEGS